MGHIIRRPRIWNAPKTEVQNNNQNLFHLKNIKNKDVLYSSVDFRLIWQGTENSDPF